MNLIINIKRVSTIYQVPRVPKNYSLWVVLDHERMRGSKERKRKKRLKPVTKLWLFFKLTRHTNYVCVGLSVMHAWVNVEKKEKLWDTKTIKTTLIFYLLWLVFHPYSPSLSFPFSTQILPTMWTHFLYKNWSWNFHHSYLYYLFVLLYILTPLALEPFD